LFQHGSTFARYLIIDIISYHAGLFHKKWQWMHCGGPARTTCGNSSSLAEVWMRLVTWHKWTGTVRNIMNERYERFPGFSLQVFHILYLTNHRMSHDCALRVHAMVCTSQAAVHRSLLLWDIVREGANVQCTNLQGLLFKRGMQQSESVDIVCTCLSRGYGGYGLLDQVWSGMHNWKTSHPFCRWWHLMDWYPPIGTIFAAKFDWGMDSHCYKRREATIRRIRHGMAESQTHHDNYQFLLLGPIGIHRVIAWFKGLSWSNMKGKSQLTLHSCIPCFCSIWRCRCLPILKVRFYFQVLCYCWIFLFQWDVPMHLQQGWQKAVI
jgi:hypothetical protein